MNRVSATDLKNRVADILNEVIFTGSEMIVERYGKPVVKITPIDKAKKAKKNMSEVIDRYFGALPDFPDVTKFRRSRRRKIPALF